MTEQGIETAADPDLAGVLFRQSGDGLLLVDALTGQVRDANPAAQRLTEFGRAELLAMTLRSLVRHEQPWFDWTPSDRAGEAREGFWLRTRRADICVPVRLAMVPFSPDEGPARLLIRLIDGRTALELRRRVQTAEAELRRVLFVVSECLWSARVSPGSWEYRYLSPAVQRLTGRAAAAFLDSPAAWAGVVVPEDRPAWQAFRDRLALGQPGSLEYRVLHAEGRTVRVREAVTAAPDEGGSLLHGVLAEVAEGSEADAPPPAAGGGGLGRALGTIAHDFNNLIAGILGNVSLAAADPSPENTAASLGRIGSIADRAADLCRRLATCAGQVPRDGHTPDPASAVRHAVAEVSAANPAVSVEVVAEAGLPAVAVDPAALGGAVGELLRNAVQAGAGRVVVRLAARAPDPPAFARVFASARADASPEGLYVQVRDDGEGIPGPAGRGLGEPFFTTRPGQRGLGVATALGVARACRGGLRLYSREGEGTVAVLSFPPALPRPAEAPAGPPAAGHRDSPLVLLVDDEAAIVDVASRLLASAGCRVLTARTGTEALEQYARHAGELRLVVLDLNLPRLGGDEVIAEIRRSDARLPIVLMSGDHDLEGRPGLAAMGLAGCLRKPFRLPEMLAMLEHLLGLPAGR